MSAKQMCRGTTFRIRHERDGRHLYQCKTCGRVNRTGRKHQAPGESTASRDRTMSILWSYASSTPDVLPTVALPALRDVKVEAFDVISKDLIAGGKVAQVAEITMRTMNAALGELGKELVDGDAAESVQLTIVLETEVAR